MKNGVIFCVPDTHEYISDFEAKSRRNEYIIKIYMAVILWIHVVGIFTIYILIYYLYKIIDHGSSTLS